VPGQGVLDAANKILDPVIVEMVARRVQSRTLAALRDTLLPKLISGELRIKDANLFVERAA
jgi:type I restriction enzyme S subunit